MHGHEVDNVQHGARVLILVSGFCKKRPVVIGSNRLADLATHAFDVCGHLRHRQSIERPIDHGLIANAQRYHDVVVLLGQGNASCNFCLVERVIAAGNPDAQHHFDIQVVIPNDFQGLLGHFVRAVKQANELEVTGHHQVQVLLDHGFSNRLVGTV